MFERYTENARRTIVFARYEAGLYGSPHIETEHLLAGLLRAARLLARSLLQRPGAGESVRKELRTKGTGRESIPSTVEIPLSGESRYVLPRKQPRSFDIITWTTSTCFWEYFETKRA